MTLKIMQVILIGEDKYEKKWVFPH
jgi:hypothetical protein